MQWSVYFIFILFLTTGIFYYRWASNDVGTKQMVFVSRVIDGDTAVLSSGERIRFLGENSPEKNQPFHDAAMNYLRKLVSGKNVIIKRMGVGKYGRTLGYVYVDGKLSNKAVLEKGLASLYYYGRDSNYEEMKNAEEGARRKEIGIWKPSVSVGCVKILLLKYKDGGSCKNQERLVLNNSCGVLNVTIKDDSSSHIYPKILRKGENTYNFSCIWNDDGDSVYIYDKSGMILFYRYGKG